MDKTTFALRELKGVLVDNEGIDTNPDIEDAFAVYESPFPIHDILVLPRDLKVKFNVFKLHHVSGKKYAISTLFNGKSPTCNIILYNNHFYFINDIDKLMRYITKRQRAERELCVNCLHYFDKRYTSVGQHKINCKFGKGSISRYPKEGQARQYTQFSFQVKSPFIIVAELEASNAANASIPSTPAQHIKTIHRINTYAYFLHIDPDLHDFPYEDFSERIYLLHVADDTEEAEQELISCFMRDIYNLAQRLKAWQDQTDQEKMLKELRVNTY